MVFEFEKSDDLLVKIEDEEIKTQIDEEKTKYLFDFKKYSICLYFKFSDCPWKYFDSSIIGIGEYENKKYFVNTQTLESSFSSEFTLQKSFPSFSSTLYNNKKYFVDSMNKLVISVNPAIRQNSVKMKIKTYLTSQPFYPFIFSRQSIIIDRYNLLESSQKNLLEFLKFKKISDLIISFKDEIGEDHGAIKKEFFYLLFNTLINDSRITKNHNLSDINSDIYCKEFLYEYDDIKQIPNILDDFITESSEDSSVFFLLLGITIGALLLLGETININFSLIFYENLLERNFTLKHIQDPEIQRSLNCLDSNELKEVIYERFFVKNKNHYDHIRFGFKIVMSDFSNFKAFDFPFIFFHFEPIMIENMKRMIKFEKCDSNTKEIKWLFKALETKNQTYLSKFLLFISGSGCIPRFDDEEYFTFEKTNYLNIPFKASVCNKKLYISGYDNYEKLLHYLDLSILYTEGFHFV